MSTLRNIEIYHKRCIVTYPALAAQNGDAFQLDNFPTKTIQASGTGTVTIEGSNDGTNYVALKDTAGVAISLAAASNAISRCSDNPKFMRAVNAGGSSLVVIIGTHN